VLAAILLLFIKTAAIFDLQDLQLQKWILIAPLYARAGLILVIRFFPYIRAQGMGSELAQGLTSRRLTCSILFVVVAPVILFLFQPKALILGELIGILTVLFGFALAKWIQFRLGGLTGDCYGAIVESTEVWALLLVIGLQKWVP
jgi:adenosylcobinamide-GDP ribazoletransferase